MTQTPKENMMQSAEEKMMQSAETLLVQLESGDSESAMQTIFELQQQRETSLYSEVGRLTRSIHEAIRNFEIDVQEDGDGSVLVSQDESSRMVDASDRLNYVIQLTENAANKTMDKVEDTIPFSKELGETAKRLKIDWERLVEKKMSADEFRKLYTEMTGFLNFTVEKTTNIDANLSDILMAQDYQDLTGQVIKKVITLVREIQGSLVELITTASRVENITGVKTKLADTHIENKGADITPEGPIINADKRDGVVTCQDDVDDLLSSLGF